jgi:tryptophan 2,3-dioxygenase
MKHEPIYYGEYLQLEKVLDSQHPKSKEHGNEAHDETLFIIIHQAYELWFKQILHEIGSVYDIFNKDKILPNEISVVNHRLSRVVEIQKVLNQQLRIIETMTPLDFMKFRDYLTPASGFQSIQFRMIELRLGLREKYRTGMAKEFFNSRLKEEDREILTNMEKEPTLFELVNKWLSRMPFAKMRGFDFWYEYMQAVNKLLDNDKKIIESNKLLQPRELEFELRNLEATRVNYQSLFNEKEYQKLFEAGTVRMNREAKLSAIFINLFSDEPILQLPYRLLTHLIEIDEMFTTWRYQHSIMAHRLLGTKIGTGGSSGHEYLKKAADNNRVFIDLFDLATFLIPEGVTPVLPKDIKRDLGFVFEV